MCQTQPPECGSSSLNFSFSLPTSSIHEIKTIVIACCELPALPPGRELDLLKPLSYLRLQGGGIFLEQAGPKSKDVVQFLESILLSASKTEFVITCSHTKCSYFKPDLLRGDCSDSSKECDSPPDSPKLETLLTQQEAIKQQVFRLKQVLNHSKNLAGREISVAGWLFETEINWLSYYDCETDMFLPLSAKAELYRSR